MSLLLPGTEVIARGLRWEVVHTQPLGQQALYRLRCVHGALQGQEFDLLHPFERVEPVIHELSPERAAPLQYWKVYHQAFLLEQALGPLGFMATQPGRLELQIYQLVPVLRAIRMSRVRMLLADDVGLGKTIQAGLILTELMARRLAHRVLIVSPAGPLLEQWRTEMSRRFGLRLDVIDRAKLTEIARATELGSNPFDYIPLGLVSIDFLKQERVLEQLERSHYDVVIVDEAHHCTDLGAAQEREDSQRRRLAQVLARRSDSLVLATATPHDGNDRSFASLCELLDPSLVDGRGSLRGIQFRDFVVRRLKRHIRDPKDPSKPMFPERRVTPIAVEAPHAAHSAFYTFHRQLMAFIAPELRRAFKNKSYSDVLSFISLLKRSVSTAQACKSTLMVVAERFNRLLSEESETQDSRRQRLRSIQEFRRKQERFGVASFEEEQEHHQLEVEDLAQYLASLEREIRAGSRQTRKLATMVDELDNLIELAEKAEHDDIKLARLVIEIEQIREREPRANILVYTEYTTSQDAAREFLEKHGLKNILTLRGDDPEKVRMRNTERFRQHDGLILISTDASAEGLNLHDRCHHLIHLELPFNPNRLEQRNGRIDRYGQTHEPQVRYFVLRGSFEEGILWRLIAKYERQRNRLQFVPNTLGLNTSTDAGAQRLLKPLLEMEGNLFPQTSTPFDNLGEVDEPEEEEGAKELLEEIDRTLNSYAKATKLHAWLGEAGLNADPELLQETDQLRHYGNQANTVDLTDFVINAAMLDGGDIAGKTTDPIFTLRLPHTWSHGLADISGYDPDSRQIRLTTDKQILSDENENEVGFLGRAHPLVRRALDRVRNLSFGGEAQRGQDVRASAIQARVPEPRLLFTFLGRVSSRSGREYEQVIAVEMSERGESQFYDTAEAWLSLVNSGKPIKTGGVWKSHFESWSDAAKAAACKAARTEFRPLAELFCQKRRESLESERKRIEEWLRQRSKDIAVATTPEVVQEDLFSSSDPASLEREKTAAWSQIDDPKARLESFASDAHQSPARRSEADGVLRIYKHRIERLEAQLALSPPEVLPLGVLMMVPEP